MASTIELQVSVTRFTDALLQTLRQTPRPLPAAAYGIQVQRVRYHGATVRHDKTSSFMVNQVLGGHDVGTGWEWIRGNQAQLAVDLSVEIATEATIAASANRLATPDFVVKGTLVFDLACVQGLKVGSLQLTAELTDLELALPIPTLPIPDDVKTWAIAQLNALLAIKPLAFDLSDAIPDGRQIENAGLAVDTSGTRLIIRAEVTGQGNVFRWTDFYTGHVNDHLGANDWAAVARADDVRLTLTTQIWDRLRQELDEGRLRTVDVQYQGLGNRAAFTITPYLNVWEPVVGAFVGGDVSVTLGVTISVVGGAVIIDIDASAAEDITDGIRAVIAGLVIVFIPMVGWLVAALLNDLIGDVLDQVSAGLAHLAAGIDALPDGTTVTETGQFMYQVRIPFKTPSAISGQITGLTADAEAIAIGGTWVTPTFTEGELSVDVSRFARTAPKVSCGATGDAELHAFDDEPQNYSSIHAQVDLASTGTAPVLVDVVAVRVPPETFSGTKLDRGSPRLPTTITLDAPGSMVTDGWFTEPMLLDVRTTLGVVRCQFDPVPATVTEDEIRLMRSLIRAQLDLCDATARPTWWLGKHGFIVGWIEHPLDDPDHITSLTGIKVEVEHALTGLVLTLQNTAGEVLAGATVGESGSASVEVVMLPGYEAPTAVMVVPDEILNTPEYADALARAEAGERPEGASFAVYRTQLTNLGGVRLSSPQDLMAAERDGAGHFLVESGGDQVQVQAGRGMTRPVVHDVWNSASGRSALGRRGGSERLRPRKLDDEPSLGPVGVSEWLAQGAWSGDVLARTTGNGIEFWHRTGAPVLVPPPVAVGDEG